MSVSSRPLAEADFDWVLRLNAAHEIETGKLDRAQLSSMVAAAYVAAVVGEGGGFVIAFDQDAAYDSPNFLWFRDRYERFVYVDRVVIDPAARQMGYGRALYGAVFEKAAADGHAIVCCEVNIDPPNPESEIFHARGGFVAVVEAKLANGKSVRYLTKSL